MSTEEFKNTILPYSKKLYPMLFRLLRNEEETRDALQDVMVKLWDKRKDLGKCRNLAAYVFTMAKNHGYDILKKKRPEGLKDREEFKLLNLEADETCVDTREKYDKVKEIIENLPEKYQKVIVLRDIDGYSFEEMSEITGLQISNLRVILSRARLKVKVETEKMYGYDTTKQFARKVL
jgi:RNA polymerase sigma-70 factor (ECF subfamily)